MWPEQTLKEVDVILWLVEPTTFIGAGEQHIAEQLKKVNTPVILVINKIDTREEGGDPEGHRAYKEDWMFRGDRAGVRPKRGEYRGAS